MVDNSRTSTPKPNPKGINEGHQNFDLSDEQFTSDGDETTWPTTKTRVADKEFLRLLTTAYNGRPDFVKEWSEPPKGYALFRLSDLTVHGHPSGVQFRSIKLFIVHLHSIMTETLDSCRCIVCRPDLHR
ncbi:unnamed protein product [Aureobasidium mustum]|uniref:Cryptic loci regulator 2 N-terminal domain-containing protein n=1 Tax=Aureobasidium mustum TaxID=2773714 RepID=A0A9N8KB75_9PEZI|nr:unnamed protein product [Aureobasidium mustum]